MPTSNKAVICPHCGYKDEDVDDHGIDGTDTESATVYFDTECAKCWRQFYVSYYVEVSITTSATPLLRIPV